MTRQIVNHDLRCVNGVTLYLPPCPSKDLINLAQPDVMAQSETPLYPIGTLAWFQGMGKKFRYARAGVANLNGNKHLAANGNYATGAGTANENGFVDGGSTTTWDVGATECTFTDTVDRVKDYYAGAHLIRYDWPEVCFEDSYIISGPPAATSAAAGRTTVIQFAEPVKYAKVSGNGLEIYLNPYSNLISELSETHVTYMGVPLLPVTAYYYFWLQTAGPVMITPDGWAAGIPGYVADSRVCMTVGGILTTAAIQTFGHQVIGTLLCRTSNDHGACWINMSLDLGD